MSTKNKKAVGYTGNLARPIPVDPKKLLPDGPETHKGERRGTTRQQLEYHRWLRKTYDRRMRELYRFYKIDPDDPDCEWRLIGALVQAHVPGLRFEPAQAMTRGAPKNRSLNDSWFLVRSVERKLEQKQK
jgi:hypothetical protein